MPANDSKYFMFTNLQRRMAQSAVKNTRLLCNILCGLDFVFHIIQCISDFDFRIRKKGKRKIFKLKKWTKLCTFYYAPWFMKHYYTSIQFDTMRKSISSFNYRIIFFNSDCLILGYFLMNVSRLNLTISSLIVDEVS